MKECDHVPIEVHWQRWQLPQLYIKGPKSPWNDSHKNSITSQAHVCKNKPWPHKWFRTTLCIRKLMGFYIEEIRSLRQKSGYKIKALLCCTWRLSVSSPELTSIKHPLTGVTDTPHSSAETMTCASRRMKWSSCKLRSCHLGRPLKPWFQGIALLTVASLRVRLRWPTCRQDREHTVLVSGKVWSVRQM